MGRRRKARATVAMTAVQTAKRSCHGELDELSTIIREINKLEYKRMQNLLFDYKR